MLEFLVDIAFGRVEVDFIVALDVNIHIKDVLDRGFKAGDIDTVGIDAGYSNVIWMLLFYSPSDARSGFWQRRRWCGHNFGGCYN